MSRIGLAIVVLSLPVISHGQWAMPQVMRSQMTLNRISEKGITMNDLLYGVPLTGGGVTGTVYLDNKWNAATLMLYEDDRLLEGYYVKYNLKDNEVEVKARNGIKVIEAAKLRSFVWKDSLTGETRSFVNGKEFREDSIPLTTMLEVLVDGPLPLVGKTTVNVKDPTYVVAFDVGSRETQIRKKTAWYYVRDQSILKITNKKRLLEVFGERSAEMDKYIKINQLPVNDQEGLVRIFQHYNKIASGLK